MALIVNFWGERMGSKCFFLDEIEVADHCFLFRRPDSPRWYYQFRFPGVANPRYRSTGHEDRVAAEAFVKPLWRAAFANYLTDKPISSPTISDMKEGFFGWLESQEIGDHSKRSYREVFDRYIVPCFGSRQIHSLTSKDRSKFIEYRRQNFRRDPPKNSTINKEINALRNLISYAVHAELIREKEAPSFPDLGVRNECVENSWLSISEYIQLRRASWKEVEASYEAIRHARMVRHLCWRLLFLLGCRTVELENLTFTECRDHTYVRERRVPGGRVVRLKVTTVRITLRGKGKVRTIVAPPQARMLIQRLRALSPDATRVCPIDIDQGFRALLTRAGLYVDADGNRRNLTSLRHTRATFDLYYRRAPSKLLADFMGHTVVQQHKTYSKVFKLLEQESLYARL